MSTQPSEKVPADDTTDSAISPAEPSPTDTLPTPESKSGPILASQLPRDFYEQFYDDFYSDCATPSLFSLGVLKSWSGSGDDEIRVPPTLGTYFVTLVTKPTGPDWGFTSVLDQGRGRRDLSLNVTSLVPDSLTDAQQWCSVGFGVPTADRLKIESINLDWTVYLIST